MHRLNVRCCCQPQKIFGTIEVPYLMPVVILKIPPVRESSVWGPISQNVVTAQSSKAEIVKIKSFSDPENGIWHEDAVYSDDRPIEFWRQFPSFIEATSESRELPLSSQPPK